MAGDLVSMFKDALVFRNRELSIDSWTFKTFTKVTPVMMAVGSALVSARQFFGEPIKCDAGKVTICVFFNKYFVRPYR